MNMGPSRLALHSNARLSFHQCHQSYPVQDTVLNSVENGKACSTELPSWAPDWDDISPTPNCQVPFYYERQMQSSERPVMWRLSKQKYFSNANTDRVRMTTRNDFTRSCSAVSFQSNDTMTIMGIKFEGITALYT